MGAAIGTARRCRVRTTPVLTAGPLLCLAAAPPAVDPAKVLADAVTVDTHSHAGGLLRVREDRPFTPVAVPMREGGLAVACLALVTDLPTHRLAADHRIRPFREPVAGELYELSESPRPHSGAVLG